MPTTELPVSVERIREALNTPGKPLITETRRPDFQVLIEERLTIEDLMRLRPEDIQAPPPPLGGVYAAEINRVFNDSVNNPLTQPYGAFASAELITIAIENLLGRYVGERLLESASAAERAAAEAAARAELSKAIIEYCATHPTKMPPDLCRAASRR